MHLEIDVQYASNAPKIPPRQKFRQWAEIALQARKEDTEFTVRIVNEAESAQLNERWRKHSGATNVLSFPCKGVKQFVPELLGDIVMCAPVIIQEAIEQSKTTEAHWAHIFVHGILHLQGYDHILPKESEYMEQLETNIMKKLGYQNPYIITVQQ